MSTPVAQQERIFFTEESTAGTLESAAGTDVMPIVAGSFDLARQNMAALQRREAVGRPANRAGVSKQVAWWESSFQCYMQHSSSAGDAPPWGRILQAAGLTETVVASTSVTYTLRDGSPNAAANLYSLSVRQEIDRGNVKVAHGCRVRNVVLDLIGDDIAMVSGDLIGAYNAPSAFSSYTSMTEYGGTMMAQVDTGGTPFTIFGYAADVLSARIRIDVTAQAIIAHNIANGLKVPLPLSYGYPAVVLEAEVLDFSESDAAAFAAALAGSVGADGTITLTDGTRTCTVTLRDPQFMDIQRSAGEPSTAQLTVACHYDGTNQPLTIVLT